MVFTNTELNDAKPIEEYTHEPTRWETVKAGFSEMTAVVNSDAKMSHYKDQREVYKQNWVNTNPENEELYNRILDVDMRTLDKLDALYDDGRFEDIESWNHTGSASMVDIGAIGVGKDYLEFRAIQKTGGMTSTKDIQEASNNKSLEEYNKAKQTLEESEYWGMELIGNMAGGITDPVTLATLPVGTWTKGAGVAGNALKSFMQEAMIETSAQAFIAPSSYAYKTELGIKTSLVQEATTAITSIIGAGTFRAVGSVGADVIAPRFSKNPMDLTPENISDLKAKDPQLGEDYENLVKSQITDDIDSHVGNLHKAEFGEAPDSINNPNFKGEELNNADDIPEVPEQLIQEAQELKASIKDNKEIKILSGEDEAGNPIYKSYKELEDEINMDEAYINKAKECFL